MIAALYVDVKRGPYAGMPGVDAWGIERDATTYAGPWPVVAHPPCGHWGRYSHKAHDDGHTGPIAVAQVRRWGGVLEHPRHSKLWRECGLPRPGELPDAFGGYSVKVFQRDWGHRADKATWLYIVGGTIPAMPDPQPPRDVWTPSKRLLDPARLDSARPRGARGVLECLSKNQRHLTPPDFAVWLVELARQVEPRTGKE
jgi:hypothetical protein